MNLALIEALEKEKIKLIAVSKTIPEETILDLYNLGQRDFGENKVQELVRKYEVLPKDIRWHMIGHLQKNKVKYIAGFINMIHSVDNIELMDVIQKEAVRHDRFIDVLLEVKIASEETKYGLDRDELFNFMDQYKSGHYRNIRICGLMGMASFTDDETLIHKEFGMLNEMFIDIKSVYFPFSYYFCELSMGMSSDYPIAIQHGATIVRIGSLLFGARSR
jgi:pyridoxal phosphate enzyme (YggS family)